MRVCSSRTRFFLTPAVMVLVAVPSYGVTRLFEEDFDQLPLGPPVDESFLVSQFPEAFTHDPPPGWQREAFVTGVGDPSIGVEEWEGWSFADRDFWIAAAELDPLGPELEGRDRFGLGSGTIIVSDPDQWNDLGNPAGTPGSEFQTLLQTPPISLASREPDEDRLVLQFESGWRGDCCDFGRNQTASIFARVGDGPRQLVLRWESAPFRDQFGNPTDEPFNQEGVPNDPNFFFKEDTPNERVWVDLSFLDPPTERASSASGHSGSASGASSEPVVLEFEMTEGGDDGYWAMDGIAVASMSTVLGDMDLNGVLDVNDIDDFAQGMLDTTAYRFDHFGEFPVTRGSLDSEFDFDDAAWFVGLLPPPSSAASQLSAALSPTPEPSAALLLSLAAAMIPRLRSHAA